MRRSRSLNGGSRVYWHLYVQVVFRLCVGDYATLKACHGPLTGWQWRATQDYHRVEGTALPYGKRTCAWNSETSACRTRRCASLASRSPRHLHR
jgi:hypothetical protein